MAGVDTGIGHDNHPGHKAEPPSWRRGLPVTEVLSTFFQVLTKVLV
jgi:hypothetical protein